MYSQSTPTKGNARPLSNEAATPFTVTRQQIATLVEEYPSIIPVKADLPLRPKSTGSDALAAVDDSVKRMELAQTATNAADVYALIFKQLNQGSCKEIIDRIKTLLGKKKYSELSPAEKEQLKFALNTSDIREVLALLEVGASKDQCQFIQDYSKGFDIPLTHLGPMRDLVRLAIWASGDAFDAGDQQQAGNWIATGMKVARQAGSDDFLICRLVQIAGDKMILDHLGGLAKGAQFPEDQAYAVLGEIAKRNYGADLTSALRKETEIVASISARVEAGETAEAVFGNLLDTEDPLRQQLKDAEYIRRNLAKYREITDRMAELSGGPYTKEVQTLADQLVMDTEALPDAEFGLVRNIAPAYALLLKKSGNATAEMDASFAAATMAVYRAKYGRNPASFEDFREVFRRVSTMANRGN